MTLANDYTKLLNKIENRLGLIPLTPHLPEQFNKEAWANVIKEDTLVTFSRYFPRKVPFTVSEETCVIKKERNKNWYYIKDEYLGNSKLLGIMDIDWTDTTVDNISVGQTAGYGYYIPNYGGMQATFDAFLAQQMSADIASMYNNMIYIDFEYPNKFTISRAGGIDVNLKRFAINLLLQHDNLQTISPTKMEVFESLAQCDIARFLYMNLRYYDNIETVYLNIDLKLNELESEAGKRPDVIDKLENAYVSASNDAIPYIMTTSG